MLSLLKSKQGQQIDTTGVVIVVFEIMIVAIVMSLTFTKIQEIGNTNAGPAAVAQDLKLMINTFVAVPGNALVRYSATNVTNFYFYLYPNRIRVARAGDSEESAVDGNIFLPQGYSAQNSPSGPLKSPRSLCLEKKGKDYLILLRQCSDEEALEYQELDSIKEIPGIICKPSADCRLRKDVKQSLIKAAQQAQQKGYTLEVSSAYRTKEYQRNLLQTIGPKGVCNPDDPTQKCRHVQGLAVDVQLLDHNGKALSVGCFGVKECSDQKESMSPNFNKYTGEQELQDVMTSAGWNPISNEWWHFNYLKIPEEINGQEINIKNSNLKSQEIDNSPDDE